VLAVGFTNGAGAKRSGSGNNPKSQGKNEASVNPEWKRTCEMFALPFKSLDYRIYRLKESFLEDRSWLHTVKGCLHIL
jgi:hypothetical protein